MPGEFDAITCMEGRVVVHDARMHPDMVKLPLGALQRLVLHSESRVQVGQVLVEYVKNLYGQHVRKRGAKSLASAELFFGSLV